MLTGACKPILRPIWGLKFPEHAPRARTLAARVSHRVSHRASHRVLNSSLSLEKSSGGWTPDGMAYLNVDGIYQATRPSLQRGKARWDEVERSCGKLMALVTSAGNDERS